MSIETIWYYTGFVFWVALVWALIGFMLWAGAQFMWAMWKKYGRYKEVVELLKFLDENEECDKKFDEWLLQRNMQNFAEARILKKYWDIITGENRGQYYEQEHETDIEVVSGGYTGLERE